MAIVNSGDADDALVDITGEGFGVSVELADPAATGSRARRRRASRSRPGRTSTSATSGPAVTLTELDEALTAGPVARA